MANGWGRAATSIGQMLMQKALYDQERQEREAERMATEEFRRQTLDLQRRGADVAELNALMGPGETASPFTPGSQLPEGARTVPIGERQFAIAPPPPAPSDAVNWMVREGPKGYTAIHPRTLETKPLGFGPPPAASAAARDLSPTRPQMMDAASRDVGMMLTEGFEATDPARRQAVVKSLQMKYPTLSGEIPGMVSEQARGGGGGAAGTPEQVFRRENTLRDDYRYETRDLADAYNFIGAALKNRGKAEAGDGAARVAMLYGFIRALDPASVVREGEVALARQASTLLQRAQAFADQFSKGKSPVIPDAMVQQMGDFMEAMQEQKATEWNRIRDSYVDQANRWSVSPEVFRGPPNLAADTAFAPPPGGRGGLQGPNRPLNPFR